jgi:hypothetical protein
MRSDNAPRFEVGDEVEWFEVDDIDGNVWRPGTVIGIRYLVRPEPDGFVEADPSDLRSAPRLPLGDV